MPAPKAASKRRGSWSSARHVISGMGVEILTRARAFDKLRTSESRPKEGGGLTELTGKKLRRPVKTRTVRKTTITTEFSNAHAIDRDHNPYNKKKTNERGENRKTSREREQSKHIRKEKSSNKKKQRGT